MFKNETLARKIEELNALKDQMDVLEFKKKQLEDEFKKDITERGVEVYEFEFEGTKHKVSYKISTRETFDTKRFKEEQPEVYKKYIKVSPSSRLTIK